MGSGRPMNMGPQARTVGPSGPMAMGSGSLGRGAMGNSLMPSGGMVRAAYLRCFGVQQYSYELCVIARRQT